MKRTAFLLLALLTAFILGSGAPLQAAGHGGVVMNFSDVEISTMVKFVSELTGKNFVLDERVKGKVSVFSPSKLSSDEAFSLFTSVLELKGFTVVQAGKVYKVVPTNNAKQSGTRLVGKNERVPLGDAFIARVFTLEQISSQEALTFLQPVISKEGHIGSFGPGNMLLVVDAASNIQKIADILFLIDTPQRREGSEIIYLKHSSAEGMTSVLREWLAGKSPRQAGTATQQPVSSGGIQVIADTRLNAILLFGPEKDKKDIRALITQLDVAPPSASSKINVYYLEHTDAVEMAKVLEGTLKGVMQTQVIQQAAGAAAQTSPFDSSKITITPDKASNSLVIMASPSDYSNLLQVIQKLDRRSKQVFVQVVIAEISLDKSRALGVQAGAVAAGALGKYLQGGGLYDPFNTFGQILGSSSTLTTTNTNPISTLINSQLADKPVTGIALIQALEANGLLNVLSTPNILTSDNKEAEIFVGENVPFQGSSNTIVGGGTTTSVDRKDIGINLKLKPQVSEGDYIRLDINQEISAVKDTITVGVSSTDRTTTKRAAKTSIVVKDKETIVIGGLIQDQEQEVTKKVPLLGDIPGLGWLFKTKNKTRTKTNLMILLTPQVVKNAHDLATISDSQRIRFSDSAKKIESVDIQKAIGSLGHHSPQTDTPVK